MINFLSSMILTYFFCDYSGQTITTTIQNLWISLLENVGELFVPRLAFNNACNTDRTTLPSVICDL